MKRIAAALVAVIAVAAIVAIPIIKDNPSLGSSSDWSYTFVDDGTGISVKYYGTDTHVVIPDTVAGWPVVEIADSGFGGKTNLISVTIPDTVTRICHAAFYNCESISHVDMPDSLTTIDTYAFAYCYSLPDIVIPSGVTSIGALAFYDCSSLASIVFEGDAPETVAANWAQNTHEDLTVYYYEGATGFTDPWMGVPTVMLDVSKHVVSFDSDGGSAVASQIVEDGALAIRPEDPIREGHNFTGWITPDGRPWSWDTPITEDITLTAVWASIPSGDDDPVGDGDGAAAPSDHTIDMPWIIFGLAALVAVLLFLSTRDPRALLGLILSVAAMIILMTYW